MKQAFFYMALFAVCIRCGTASGLQRKENWTYLFNANNLEGWDTYIGFDRDSTGKKLSETPVGLNRDPRKVFTVVSVNGEKLIRISGEEFGAISTKVEYANYHLQLQFRWGKLQWGIKKNRKYDSGILYHSVGDYGADYDAWMRSQEFQIEHGNTGDYWGVAGGIEDIPAIKKSEKIFVYNPGTEKLTFSERTITGRHCIKQLDAERPVGEWNTVDLYCSGDTSIHLVNGKVAMVLFHSRQWDGTKEIPLLKGKIQIQSEGAEVFYKGIKLKQISQLPNDLLQ